MITLPHPFKNRLLPIWKHLSNASTNMMPQTPIRRISPALVCQNFEYELQEYSKKRRAWRNTQPAAGVPLALNPYDIVYVGGPYFTLTDYRMRVIRFVWNVKNLERYVDDCYLNKRLGVQAGVKVRTSYAATLAFNLYFIKEFSVEDTHKSIDL